MLPNVLWLDAKIQQKEKTSEEEEMVKTVIAFNALQLVYRLFWVISFFILIGCILNAGHAVAAVACCSCILNKKR